MREGNPYRNIPTERALNLEAHERRSDVPIIDIVRHGETDYKELSDPNMEFDPTEPSFTLTPEYLDLTEEGIENIRATAEQLEAQIDKEHEVVIMVTSPNFRAHSSALLIEEYLRNHGVTIANANASIPHARNLGQTKLKNKDFLPEWVKADKLYREESEENAKKTPEVAHAEIAARLGLTLEDIFAEDYADMDRRFNRFLRHATNIYDWLTPETKAQLEGRQIRIVCVTHEEIPKHFLADTLDLKDTLLKSQMVEVRPERPLRAGSESEAEITLFPKGASQGACSRITRSFNP